MFQFFKKKENREDKLENAIDRIAKVFELVAKRTDYFKKDNCEFSHYDQFTTPHSKFEYHFMFDGYYFNVGYNENITSKSFRINRHKKAVTIADFSNSHKETIDISYYKGELTVSPLLGDDLKAEDVYDQLEIVYKNALSLLDDVFMSYARHEVEVDKLKSGLDDEKRLYFV